MIETDELILSSKSKCKNWLIFRFYVLRVPPKNHIILAVHVAGFQHNTIVVSLGEAFIGRTKRKMKNQSLHFGLIDKTMAHSHSK